MHSGDACPCKRVKCQRHGNCAACREHHGAFASERKRLTACERLRAKAARKSARARE